MTVPVSGEIWFKTKRALRTAVQVVVTGAGILAVAVVVAPQILDAIAEVLPGPVVAWAAGVIAAAATLSAALSRVMAIPAVDSWLKRIGLGSAPRDAEVEEPREIATTQGPAGTFADADARTVPADQPARVRMSGPGTARVAHFDIPRGLPGTGAPTDSDA